MKILVAILLIVLALLQYKLWFAQGGVADAVRLKKNITSLEQENVKLKDRNAILEADVKDLKTGNAAIEGRARSELGMVKKGEVFYQVVK